jgi:hypothetical protein
MKELSMMQERDYRNHKSIAKKNSNCLKKKYKMK